VALAETAAERLGGVDVLVHNAFVQPPLEPIERASLDTWRHAFDVNLFGAVRTSMAALPHLRERGGGAIVFVGSMSARRIQRRFGVYAATKAALHTMTQSLALELGPDGIRVNAVVPGYIWGPNLEWWCGHLAERRDVDPQVVYDEVASETALRRLPTAEEVAEAAVFLASDRARAVTGQALDVNAGHWFH
jgi:NAD(P)-dependent dehydrogenase (short-subunit alcohol dehydrogenase family)